ncbi:MAG TPA: GWxTD domain-containing protein [Thermoanaerobaculia bacterium]
MAVGSVAGLAGCATTEPGGGRDAAAELTNPLLSPAWSQWLVGPIAEMATPEEEAEYLGLASDEAAAAFVDAFWERRKPYPLRPDNPLREQFEARAEEADRLYSEAGYLGRRTARGTVHVLHGPPEQVDYQLSQHPDDPPVTVWRYPADAPPGLHGRPPQQLYRFIKRGDITEFFRPRVTPVTDRPGSRRPGTVRPGDFPAPPPT